METSEEETPQEPYTYLVTGGCGFVGRKIVEALRKANQRVLVLDRKDMPDIPSWLGTTGDGLGYMKADLRDEQALLRACAGIETVFHTARSSDPNGEYPVLRDINVEGTRILLEAAKSGGVRSFVYTSSVSVVVDGNDINGGDESMSYATKHLDHASATKCEAEQLVLGADCPDFHTCALRPEMIFGPGDNSFVPKILDKAREGEMTHMIGDGANVVDFTYIDNVILAHLLAAEHLFQGSPVCGSAYFITNGEVMPFWEFLRRILGGMGFPVPTKAIGTTLAYGTAYALEKVGGLLNYFVRFKPKLTRQLVFNMSKNHYFKHTKATQDFGYKPVVTLEEGIHRTLGFYRTNQAIRVSVDLRIFDMWNICRTSLWGGDKEALSLQPSRATSTASLDSLEGMGLILEPRHSGSRRLSFGGEFVGSPDESEVLEELNGMQLHARKSIPGLHGASPEQAPDQPDESSRAVPRKGRSSPGRKSPGHVPAGFCPPILEHTEHTVRHTELTSIKPEPVRSSLNSRTNLVHPHPMVSSS